MIINNNKQPTFGRRTEMYLIILGIFCVSIFTAILLPLRELWYHESLIYQIFPWTRTITQAIFHQPLIYPEAIRQMPGLSNLLSRRIGWEDTILFSTTLILLFGLYLVAVRRVSKIISFPGIIITTLLIAIPLLLTSALTSSDVFSYTAYARMGVFYNLNPMTTIPRQILSDPIYRYVYWKDQPSAYGPVWIGITWGLQKLLQSLGFSTISPMILTLRGFTLLTHLASTALVWSLLGRLLPSEDSSSHRKRVTITLAFAWNPLLLFEAATNAHNEIVILCLLLLSLWFMLRGTSGKVYFLLLGVFIYALATNLKINYILLAPGYLFFLWMQSPRRWSLMAGAIAIYLGTIILLYAPFWQNGQVLTVFIVNPATNRNINTPFEFITVFVNGLISDIARTKLPPLGTSPIERVTHLFSLLSFVIVYLSFIIYTLRHLGPLKNFFGLVRWMALAWLFYCILGTPWFWPWYTVSFIGLYTLLEACPENQKTLFDYLWTPEVTRSLAFTALTIYCFFSWAPQNLMIFSIPGLSIGGLRGLWLAALPTLLFIRNYRLYRQVHPLSKRGISNQPMTAQTNPTSPLTRGS